MQTRVGSVMTRIVVTFTPGELLRSAARKLAQNSISGGPVVEGDRVVGMLSQADVLRVALPPQGSMVGGSPLDALASAPPGNISSKLASVCVSDVMTRGVIQVRDGESVCAAADLMDRHGIKRLPVVDDQGALMGIVSRGDVVRAIAHERWLDAATG